MLPQYFRCKSIKNNFYTINIAGDKIKSLNPPVQKLRALNAYFESRIPFYLSLEISYEKLLCELIELDIVTKWLEIKDFNLNYNLILDFLKKLESRTNENSNIGYNFIINFDIKSDQMNFFEIEEHKSLDLIGESNYTYIELDKNYNFIDYNCINNVIVEDDSIKDFLPNFLNPLKSLFLPKTKKLGISKTKIGDIIIYSKSGLLASKRKGHWKIYDPTQIKNTFVDIISNTGASGPGYWIAHNLYQLSIELSYKRHGALIIFAKENNMDLENIISNKESIISNVNTNKINVLLKNTIEKIDLSTRSSSRKYFPILIELASIDGAMTISNEGKIYSFSSIIKSHEAVNRVGARSTAAWSAIEISPNVVVLKISSDGEIEMIFKRFNENLSLKFF